MTTLLTIIILALSIPLLLLASVFLVCGILFLKDRSQKVKNFLNNPIRKQKVITFNEDGEKKQPYE